MPILDKFGNEIEHHTDFPNDLKITNIEFGAGKNNFGKIEYPKCYVTDLTYPESILHFKNYVDYKNEDCHYLDDICDFYEHKFERKFKNVILCNPYGYGFDKLGSAKKFFNRAGDILIHNGKIQIIGRDNNKFCKKESLDNFLKNEIEIYKSKYDFELESFEVLDVNHLINKQYTFYQRKLMEKTIPNEKLVIKKL